jgi:hypothetical protein
VADKAGKGGGLAGGVAVVGKRDVEGGVVLQEGAGRRKAQKAIRSIERKSPKADVPLEP